MHKIVCECCVRLDRTASWIIFNEVMICEECRLAAINWFHADSDLDFSHPFISELMDVMTPTWVKEYHARLIHRFLRES